MKRQQLQILGGMFLMVMAAEGVGDDWIYYGSNTLRLETYDSEGATAASPYSFTGGQYYNEFSLNFSRQKSTYERTSGQIYGVYNESDYRSSESGIVPERLSLLHEKGDGDLPFRLHVGDYYGYFSYLTLQNSLKGAQLELQPHIDSNGNRHSIVLLAGERENLWKNIDLGDDLTTGTSWLIDSKDWGLLNFTLVHNQRDSDSNAGTLDRKQTTLSGAVLKEFILGKQSLTLESELAWLNGDHNGIGTAASGQSRNGSGLFLELSGLHQSLPLDYRFRTEQYDQDFQPAGAVVTSDRRSSELHSGWRFDSGLKLKGRIQHFEDAVDTANSTETLTFGANLSGSFESIGLSGVTGSLDGYQQTVDNESRTTDQKIQSINANLSKSLSNNWMGRLNFFAQILEDYTVTDADSDNYQITVDGSHPLSIAGFEGFITPGVVLRMVEKSGNTSDWSPTVAFNLAKGPHEVQFNYNFLMENSHQSGGSDVNTHNLAMDYRYQYEQNTFGVELELFDRDPSPGSDTEANAIRFFWTYQFDNEDRSRTSVGGRGGAYGFSSNVGADIASLAPGLLLNDAEVALRNHGASAPITLQSLQVYEHALFNTIGQRQRVVLDFSAKQITNTALIIEFDDVGNTESMAQTFNRVRRAVIKRYGSPTFTLEEGDFTGSVVSKLSARKLVRVDEWSTQQGTLRFGIPRRLDGQVRMELQHRRSFSDPRDMLWSVEQVR